jgi:hypothetical protein
MNTLRQIPLHMLLLAGLVGTAEAKDKTDAAPATQADKAAVSGKVAYAGLNVGPRAEGATASIPAGVGIQVGFIDPQGPSAGKVEEGDTLTRLDDQVLFNAEQFRALVRTRKPGEKAELTLVRGAEPMVVEIVLGERAEERGAVGRTGRAGAVDTPPGLRVTPGAALPEELLRQLEDMRAGIMPAPGARSRIPTVDELRARSGASSSSHSFSFSFGNGAQTSSHSMASDGEGSVSLEEKDGKKHAVVKDRDGKTLFEGDVTDKAAVEKLPADVRRRLKLVEGKGFSLPGFPGGTKTAPAPAEEPKKKFDPKQGA